MIHITSLANALADALLDAPVLMRTDSARSSVDVQLINVHNALSDADAKLNALQINAGASVPRENAILTSANATLTTKTLINAARMFRFSEE